MQTLMSQYSHSVCKARRPSFCLRPCPLPTNAYGLGGLVPDLGSPAYAHGLGGIISGLGGPTYTHGLGGLFPGLGGSAYVRGLYVYGLTYPTSTYAYGLGSQ